MNSPGTGRIVLVEPSESLAQAFLDMNEDFRLAGEPQYRKDVSAQTYLEFLSDLRSKQVEEHLPPNLVPQATFWLLLSNGKIAGEIRFRPRLNERLEKEGGHVGYMVRPSERNKGYATLMLRLLMDHAREKGLQRLLITCDTDNVASAKVIEKNGGILDSRDVSVFSGKPISRYWVEL